MTYSVLVTRTGGGVTVTVGVEVDFRVEYTGSVKILLTVGIGAALEELPSLVKQRTAETVLICAAASLVRPATTTDNVKSFIV